MESGDEQLANKKFTWVDGVAILTNLLYDREKKQKQPAIYSFRGRENEGQVTEDTETKDLSSDDIRTQLEKDKNALYSNRQVHEG